MPATACSCIGEMRADDQGRAQWQVYIYDSDCGVIMHRLEVEVASAGDAGDLG